MIITIDGPAGAGKSTISKELARRLSYTCLDTGAIYRAIAYQAEKEGITAEDDIALADMCKRVDVSLKNTEGQFKVFVNHRDVTDYLRSEKISMSASKISAIPSVRSALLPIQQKAGASDNIVAEGRDMGTVVFPHAEFKYFLDASIKERAKRRFRELMQKNIKADMSDIEKDISRRDDQDRQRKISPLVVPKDAIIIDSTSMTINGVIETILNSMHMPTNINT